MRAIAIVLLLLAAASMAPAAQAHARPVTITPSAGARLETAPTEIRIEFSEPVNPRSTIVDVFDANGTRIDTGSPVVQPRTTVRVGLHVNDSDQGYLVRWSTYSIVDGHRMAGSWGFAVGNATPPQAYEDVRAPLSVSTVAARLFAYTGLIGVIAFQRLAGRPASGNRRLAGVGLGASGLLVLGSAFLMLQGASASGALLRDEYTRRVAWQVASALLLTLSFAVPTTRPLTWIRGLLLAAWILVQGFSSHALPALGAPGALLDAIHLGLVALWIGSAASLWLDPSDVAEFIRNARTTTRIAVASATGAVATGLALAAVLTVLSDRSPTSLPTTYAIVLVFKLASVASLLAFGAANHFVHVRRLGSAPDRPRLLRANLRRELANATIVLLVAAILATLDPQIP